jgi:arylsulfatase A-like enzyme
MTTRPNLLFVLADQLRAASLPICGGATCATKIETPNMDRLAAGGVTLIACAHHRDRVQYLKPKGM